MLLWQSLQVQDTCTESCCSDKACKYGLLVQSHVALTKPTSTGNCTESYCSDKACEYGLLAWSHVALTKPAIQVTCTVMLLWQSLQVQVTCTVMLLWQSLWVRVTCIESCCPDKACNTGYLYSHVALTKPTGTGYLYSHVALTKRTGTGYLYSHVALTKPASTGYLYSHVALTKPASTGYLYRVMLLWQSLHVQVCVLCRCDCEQSLRWQVHVISDLFEQSLHVYNTLVWCHSDGYDAVRAWSVYWYLWDVMELRQSWCYRHNLLWFITGLGNLLVKVLLKGCNSPGQRLWCDGEWEVLTLTFVG